MEEDKKIVEEEVIIHKETEAELEALEGADKVTPESPVETPVEEPKSE